MKMIKRILLFYVAFTILMISACTLTNAENSENKNIVKGEKDMSNVRLKYMGQGTIRIITEDKKVIYIDPFAGDDYDMSADLILQTHDHFDHSALEKVSNRNQKCQIITEKEALIDGEHKTFDLPFVKVISVEAGYNKNHDVNKCVGYVLEFNDGIKVYVSGDTSKTRQMVLMSSMNIDYAFFCIDGIFNMGNDEAAECAKLVNAKHNIPYHNDTNNNDLRFNRKKAEEWDAPNKMIIDVNEEIILN